ncbi:PAS domain S-box-containing protein/diguanylate cyclase (GGDEF) domain-containing protein [Paenibacillus algorifonticola]|uniref:PAS domain S-box-containing protein/diguanylate cyclase (GGDEF) domain-containing protein n=1 Tax=Paenibacillus algorifonticola TaxID=684063 RepID=A0A1I2I6E9_9BACL|nr:bifunctional diguanylate cyclase/phosphodiesterase [Paenibacillus algorifonticola]SFF38049.1 PAS domain S-box-containing protein/diguanylate cyclase (GGDEF) domain-containing protein [Paenibacillus algorifonticola]
MGHLHGTYDSSLIIFSYIIAVLASFAALDLAEKVGISTGRKRWLGITMGAVILGMGIWSMHFVGMMAFSLPVVVAYDLIVVLLSLLAVIVAAFAALYVIARDELKIGRLLAGGLLLATGVSVMHYIGMEAMLIQIHYDPLLFLLSIFIAFAASVTALWLVFYFRKTSKQAMLWKKLSAGMIMGAAIAGMHYTGMIAATFSSNIKTAIFFEMVLANKLLAYVITAGSVITCMMSLLVLFVSKRLESKETQLDEHEKWYKSLFDNNLDGIISVNIQGEIIGFNPAALEITGLTSEQLLHQPIKLLLPYIAPDQLDHTVAMFTKAFQGEAQRYTSAILRNGEERVDISVVSAPVIVGGAVVGIYVIAKDISEEKQAEEKVKYLAFHDELTGLPNRRMFNKVLDEEIERTKPAGEEIREDHSIFAVMVLDIDRFKMINDSLGHSYGDLFLQEMGNRIRSSVDGYNVLLARMGGDEFTLMVPHSDAGIVTEIAEKIIHAIQLPYRLKESDFYVSASIGIALYPQHGMDTSQLLKNADTAMYEVKKKGKNGFQYFSAELNDKLQSKIELEGDLRKAVELNELELYYQPQIRAEDERMIGIEALVRWNHPTKGVLSPGIFIPIAEETGIIYELGTWVLREACRQMRKWHLAGGPLIPVSVNLSSQQFHQPYLADYVKDILRETGLEPHFLELEITESMMMDASVSTAILNQLNEFGVRISLDDFGTGYSSLSYLKMFPIHKVKIDRSFIRDITENDNDKAIVSTIISMAQHLNMEVIAEGIETKAQLDILTDKDCEKIQGYYFSRPLSAIDVEEEFFIPGRQEKTAFHS